MPKFSVIIAVYNGERYLRDAIDSVIGQTYDNYEIVVVDDGSTDGTRSILQSYGTKIKWFSQDNAGVAAARNRALQIAIGEYIALLDQDDLWLPRKLEFQARLLNNHPRVALTWAGAVRFKKEPPSNPMNPPSYHKERIQYTPRDLLVFDKIAALTAVFKREIALRVGAFDPKTPGTDDWDLWIRIASRYPIKYLPKTMALYRLHEGQQTKNVRKLTLGELYVVKKNKKVFLQLPEGRKLYRHELAKRLATAAIESVKASNYQDAFKLSVQGLLTGVSRYRSTCLKVLAESLMGTGKYSACANLWNRIFAEKNYDKRNTQ